MAFGTLCAAALLFPLHTLGLLLVVGPLLPFAAAYLIFAYLSGRKSVVLYLRKFGLAASGRMITSALESGLSRRFRVVTLDDANFAALELPRWTRRFSRYGPPGLALALVIAFALLVRYFRQAGLGEALWLLATAQVGGFVVVLNLWLFSSIFGLLLLHRFRIRRRARGKVDSVEQLRQRLRETTALSNRLLSPTLLAPQTVVLEVDDSLWRDTVESLRRRVGAVLIDVSQPTANLAWELEHVLAGHRQNFVLVGDRKRIEAWRDHAHYGSEADPAALTASTMLEGMRVLVYDTEARAGRRRFQRHLMRALDEAAFAGGPPNRLSEPQPRAVRRLVHGLRLVALYSAVPVVALGVLLATLKYVSPDGALFGLIFNSDHPLDRVWSPRSRLERRGIAATPQSLAEAARQGEAETADMLISTGVDANTATAAGWTPLLLAVAAGDSSTVNALLGAGADVRTRTPDGRSAVELAAAAGHTTVLAALLDAGAAAEVDSGWTPLMSAALAGHSGAVTSLLARGADVKAHSEGTTPLMLAALQGHGDIVDRLLASGAEVNAQNYNGRTPLILAAIEGCDACVRSLLAAGADARVTDAFGHTAEGYAALNRWREIGDMLGARLPEARTRADPAVGRGPHLNLLLVGESRRTAAALASALTRVLAPTDERVRFASEEKFRLAPLPSGARGRGRPADIAFRRARRSYALYAAARTDFEELLVSTGDYVDAIVLTTSMGSASAVAAAQLSRARDARIPAVIVALEGDATESEIRALLRAHGYAAAPVVRVSSRAAITDSVTDGGMSELLDALDARVPPPPQDRDRPFMMLIEALIPGTPWYATGSVVNGMVRLGDTLELVGFREPRTVVVSGIQTFRKKLDQAITGDEVGLAVDGITADEAERGRAFTAVGSVVVGSRLTALVHFFGPADGGLLERIPDGSRLLVHVRYGEYPRRRAPPTVVTATMRLRAGTVSLTPGEIAVVTLELARPIPIVPRVVLQVSDRTRVVGTGLVIDVSPPQEARR